LAALLAKRYDSYRSLVVQPFFQNHFARLDRQIVLVDALGALNAGAPALARLESTLEQVLRAFRPGAGSWLTSILSRRIDRILLAAAKADHVHHEGHDRLEALLAQITRQAAARAKLAGATVDVLALAAIRATREAEVRQGAGSTPVIVGTPLPGERIAGEQFDGRREAGVFPGDLPELTTAVTPADLSVVRFRPPRLAPDGPNGEMAVLPHIRLDRALQFLIGDKLA
jgi:predicted YcjX-like family ATPase